MNTPIVGKTGAYAKKSASKSHSRRASFEFYATPPEATRALLSVEKFDGDIREPACGDGAISEILIEAGYHVVSTDLIDRGYGRGGMNFLKSDKPLAKHIITNPPHGKHGLADLFIRQALIHCRKTGGSVAMLLNLRSLCHPDRTEKYKRCPPAAIYALDDLTIYPERRQVANYTAKNRQHYFWGVWKPGFKGRPVFRWLETKEFRDKG